MSAFLPVRRVVLAMLSGMAGAGAAHAAAPDGGALYLQNCAACHQANAEGAAGQFPPLKNHVDRIAATAEGRHYLAAVLTHGLAGPINIGGDSYVGYMPAFPQLKDEEIAAILNWVAAQGTTRPVPTIEGAVIAGARAEALAPPQVNAARGGVAAASVRP